MNKLGTRALRHLVGPCLLFALLVLLTPAAFALGNPSAPHWVEYKEGEYLDRIKAIFRRQYNVTLQHIARDHYPGLGWVGDVDVFRVSAGETCEEKPCYYVMFSATLGEIPFITDCPFERAVLTDILHADGSNYFAFLFSCESSVFQVQVSRDHFWINSEQKPGK